MEQPIFLIPSMRLPQYDLDTPVTSTNFGVTGPYYFKKMAGDLAVAATTPVLAPSVPLFSTTRCREVELLE
jgi:hypothetical protein